jgi:hypothetical protein
MTDCDNLGTCTTRRGAKLTSRQIAQGRVDWDRDHFLVTVTGPCSDGDDSATVELRDTEWHALPPVRQAVDEELARRGVPLDTTAAAAGQPARADTLPHAWIDPTDAAARRAILTARRAGGEEAVTIAIPWDQWVDLAPVQWVMEEELERREERKQFDPMPRPLFPVPVMRWLFLPLLVVLDSYFHSGDTDTLGLCAGLAAMLIACMIWNAFCLFRPATWSSAKGTLANRNRPARDAPIRDD